jgi:RNA polymerase sigma factor (sigma-70 family)
MESNSIASGYENLKCYNEVICANPVLSREDELALVKIIMKLKSGTQRQEARDKLIKSNMKLVIKEAARVTGVSGVPIMDLIGAGIEGLCMAIDRFDPCTYKTKLSTYAVPWIKLKIGKCVFSANSNVYIPRHIKEQSRKYHKSFKDGDDALNDKDLMKELDVTEKSLRNIKAANAHVLSLDAPRFADNGDEQETTTIGDAIPNNSAVSAEKIVQAQDAMEMISSQLSGLDPIASDIITRRYLSDEKEGLAEIGKDYDMTGERIRQIEFKALKLLRRRMKNRAFFGV